MGYLEDMQSPILHRENQSSGSTRFALQNPSLLDANAVGERDQLAQDSGTSFGMADAGFDDLKQEARIKRAESVPGADKFVDKAQENVAFLDADADGLSSTYQSLLDNGMLDESEFSPDQFDAIKNGRSTLERARLQMEYANLGNSYVNGQVKTPEDLAALRDKLSVLKERMRTLDADKDDPTFLFSALEQGYRMVTSDFPAILKGGAKGASWGMVAGMGIGATGGAAVGSVVPLAGTAAGATAGAIAGGLSGAAAGFKAGAAGAMYEQSQKLETGSMMADQLLEKDDLGQYVDPEAAKIAAQGYGLVAGLVEVGGDVVGAKIAFGPALKFLQSKFGKTAGKAVVGGAVKAAMRDKMLGPAVMGFVRRMGAGAGAEGLEEGTQESANILAENFLKKYLNSTGQNYFRDDQSFFSWDNMRRIGQSTWEGAAVGLWFHMLPGLTKLGSDMYGVSRAREFSEKHKAVADAVAQSKTKEISPVRMQSYLETQGFNQTVVIPADAALELQQKGVDIAGPLGWNVNDLQEAATLGHEIQVKASVLQAHLPTDVMKQVADIMRESEVSQNVLDAARADELLAQDRDELMADVEQFAIDEGMAEHEFDRLRTEITEMVRSIPQLMAQITASADPETSLSSFVDSSMRLLRSHYNQTAQHAMNGRQEADNWLSSLHFQGDVRDAQGKEMTPEQVLAQWEQEAAASPEAGLWEGVWGKVDLEGLRKTNPNLAAELARTHGRGLFAPAGEGKSLADLSAEMQAAGVVAQDVDEKALGEALRTRQHPRIYDARRVMEKAGESESRAPLSRESLVGQIEEEFAEAEKEDSGIPEGGVLPRSLLPKTNKQVPRHSNANTLDEIYEVAEQLRDTFRDEIREIAEVTGGVAHFRESEDPKKFPDRIGLKGRNRAQEKLDRDYDGTDAGRIVDVLGATILYKAKSNVAEALPNIMQKVDAAGGKVIRVKDRYASPAGGYKDVLMNIRMSNGFVTELLVTTEAMSEAKNGIGHKLYEAYQSTSEALKKENLGEDGRKAAEDIKELLDDTMQAYYASTGEESNSTASASVILYPLNKISASLPFLSSSSLYPKLESLLGTIRKTLPPEAKAKAESLYSMNRLMNTGALGPDASQGVLERSLPSMERASEGISEPPIDNDIVSPKGPESNRQTPKKTLNSKIEDGILRGDETTLIGSRGDEKAHYEIREAGSLIPSHDPANGFAKRADYPEGVQERPYHSDVEEQNKVRQHAADLKPALLISDNAEASNGPSIITKDGIVLGGNSRVMTMQTAYADYPGKADDYRAMLKDRAERFGMAPEAVDSFEQPVLVRVVDEDMDVQGMAVRSRLYNETTTQGLQAKAEGVSRARMISDDTIAVMAADMEDFDTVREYLASPASKRLVESLITDGVIETTQIARLVSDGKLTDEGKALVENALRGLIVQDYDVLQAAPASVLQKLDRAILSLAQLKKRGGGWDMSNVVTEALRIIGKADARDTSVSMLIGQNSLMQGMNDAANAKKSVQAVALTMENATPKEIAARFAHMAKAAGRPGEGSTQGLLGIAPESNSPATAFVEAFLETIATVDGKPVKAFDPEKNEKHAAIAFAYKHGGRGHSITAAQGAIEKLLHKKKITPENREMLRGYLSALGPLSGTVALYPPKLGQFFSYQPGQDLFQTAYHGTPHRFDSFTLDHIGEGEGAQVHGWGLYFTANKEIGDKRYRERLLNRKRSDYVITENGNPVSSEATNIINSELGGSVLYEAAIDGKQDLFRKAVRNHIEYLKKGDTIGNDIIDVITKAIAKIDDNPKLSISKFLSEVPSEEKYRFETLVHGARRLAKSEGRRATIADVREMCVQHRAPFLKQREQYLAEAAELEKLDVDSLNIKENEGQLFEVDIPENDVLLDEQKSFEEQPKVVQEAFLAARKEFGDNTPLRYIPDHAKSGEGMYAYLRDTLGSDKAASLWLNDHGVKGITYEGRIDGRCFVVFDDKAIGILNTFYARNAANGKAEVAGSITPLDDQYFIRLMRGANLSTLAHESAHAMFLHMRSLVIRGQADERLVRDYETLQKWTSQLDDDAVLKKEYDTYQKDAYGGRAFDELTADEKLVVRETAAQEWLARGFEEYLREGKAPTKNLAGIFRRFAKWLTRVYRTLATLNISVPDDVRAVFDRMLASEEDIDAAAEARDVKEASAGILDALGLQGADRLQVQGMIQDAKDAAAESLRRERRKEFMEKREQWENEADEEMADDPVYKARESMRKRPISYSTLADVYGEDMAKALAKKLPGSVQRDENVKADAEAPMNPEELALAMGFENAGEMVQAILDRPGKTERKKELVAQKAREAADKYDPDDFLFEQEGLAEQQDKIGEALYRMEESGRTQAGAPVQGNGARAVQRVGRDQLRTLAGEWLDAKSAKDATSPHMFRLASAKAMREERRAILAHDWAAAIKANWQARINLELARQAAERRDLVLKIARGAKRFVVTDKADTGARYGVFCLSMLGKLFDPTTKMLANAGDKTHADVVTFLDRMQEEGYYTPDAGIPDTLFRGEPTAWREQAWTDVQPRLEAIAVIMHIERASRKANDELNKESWRAEMDAIAESILSLNSHREPDAMAPKSTILGILKDYHADHLKGDTIALLLDGDQDMGPAWRAIIRPINQATWKRNERMKEEGDKLRKIFSVYSHKELMEMRGKRVFVRELNKAITKEQMIAILLNCGNESNKDRLMRGNNLTEEQIQAVIDKLDERDVRFVQNIWDYFETFRKESFDIEERLTGARPKAIPASPIVTKYGILRGGYYPVAYDSQASSKPIDTESIGSVTGSMFPAVDHGSMKSRTAMGLGTALNLSLDVVPQHVTKTLHMIAFREPVQKVARVLNDRAVNAAIESTAGVEQAKALKKWLHYVAGERPANNGWMRRLAGGLRKRTALFTMGFKLTTMLAQMTGLLITVSEIGLKWTLLGVGKAAKNPLATWRFISSMSPMMRNRINAVDRDVYEASQKMLETGSRFAVLDVPKRIQALMEKKAFIPMAFVQMSFCDAPTWMGAYHKGLEMFAGDRQQAAEYADTIVERTQVGGADKDLADVQRGDNLHKLVSMYYSFFSALYQVATRRVTMLNRRRDAASVYRLATFMLLTLMAEPVLSALLTGHGPEDDEEPIPWAIREMFFQPFNMFIGVRDIASACKSRADGFDGKYRPSAALDAFNSIGKFVYDVLDAYRDEGKRDAKKLTVEGGRALGQATGWVAFDSQMMLMLENFWSWLDGSNPDMELADILKKRKKK